MTAVPSIDPARFLTEQLSQASPDLMRDLLTTFRQRAALRPGRRGVWRRLRRTHAGAGQLPQRLPPPRPGHPGRHPRCRGAEAADGIAVSGVAARASQACRAGPDLGGATCYLLGVSTRRLDRPGRSRSWQPTRSCSRSERVAGWCRCTCWLRPGSTPTDTGRSWACRSPPVRMAPAGWRSSVT
jgi:hypothetical protein